MSEKEIFEEIVKLERDIRSWIIKYSPTLQLSEELKFVINSFLSIISKSKSQSQILNVTELSTLFSKNSTLLCNGCPGLWSLIAAHIHMLVKMKNDFCQTEPPNPLTSDLGKKQGEDKEIEYEDLDSDDDDGESNVRKKGYYKPKKIVIRKTYKVLYF